MCQHRLRRRRWQLPLLQAPAQRASAQLQTPLHASVLRPAPSWHHNGHSTGDLSTFTHATSLRLVVSQCRGSA